MVITLSSVVSSLKMDATKILDEMDQFKELWNQVMFSNNFQNYKEKNIQLKLFNCHRRKKDSKLLNE